MRPARTPTAAAYIEADVDDEALWGVGIHSSIVTASLRAVVSAVNRARAMREARRRRSRRSTACRRRWSGCQAGSPRGSGLAPPTELRKPGAEARLKVGLAGLCVVVLGRHSVRRTLASKLDLEPLELPRSASESRALRLVPPHEGRQRARPPTGRAAQASLRRNAPPSPRCANSRPPGLVDHPHLVKSAGPGVSRRASSDRRSPEAGTPPTAVGERREAARLDAGVGDRQHRVAGRRATGGSAASWSPARCSTFRPRRSRSRGRRGSRPRAARTGARRSPVLRPEEERVVVGLGLRPARAERRAGAAASGGAGPRRRRARPACRAAALLVRVLADAEQQVVADRVQVRRVAGDLQLAEHARVLRGRRGRRV